MAHPDSVVNLAEKLARIEEHWSPKIVGQLNDLHVKVVKLQGEFVWHQHDGTDEFFRFVRPDGREIPMDPGRTWLHITPTTGGVTWS